MRYTEDQKTGRKVRHAPGSTGPNRGRHRKKVVVDELAPVAAVAHEVVEARVLGTVGEMPEVSGVAPFSINEMMLTKGERRAVVLVKGVTPSGQMMPFSS